MYQVLTNLICIIMLCLFSYYVVLFKVIAHGYEDVRVRHLISHKRALKLNLVCLSLLWLSYP